MVGEKKYNPLRLKLSKLLSSKSLKNTKRNIEVCSIEKAKKVGVTFAVRNKKELDFVKKFLKELSNRGIQTFALGYIPEKKPTDFYLSEKAFNFFSDKELDWLLRPNNSSAIEFQESEFDILIDFGTEEYYPMNYLLFKSKAKFKVGWFVENGPFDLMMDIKKESGLEYYFSQVMHYLSNLN